LKRNNSDHRRRKRSTIDNNIAQQQSSTATKQPSSSLIQIDIHPFIHHPNQKKRLHGGASLFVPRNFFKNALYSTLRSSVDRKEKRIICFMRTVP